LPLSRSTGSHGPLPPHWWEGRLLANETPVHTPAPLLKHTLFQRGGHSLSSVCGGMLVSCDRADNTRASTDAHTRTHMPCARPFTPACARSCTDARALCLLYTCRSAHRHLAALRPPAPRPRVPPPVGGCTHPLPVPIHFLAPFSIIPTEYMHAACAQPCVEARPI
jgi:hypothetical protein